MAQPQYVAASRLRAMILELIRMHVPSVTDLRLDALRGPYRAGNRRVEWLNVPVEDYGAARDNADAMEAKRHWIMVPDGHMLNGQVFERERGRDPLCLAANP